MPWTAIGLTFAAGQNPYAALFLLAVLARSDNVDILLHAPFAFLSHTATIGVLFVLAGVQVFADKHPRWRRTEALTGLVARPLSAAMIVLSLIGSTDTSVLLWVVVAIVVAHASHFFRVRLRRQLADKMAGMGYFLASLSLDSAALITGLLAILAPVVGAVLGASVFASSAVLSLRMQFNAGESGEPKLPNQS